MINSLIKEETNKKKLIYKPPLPKKMQRVQAKAERRGKVRIFSEEQIFLENVRRAAKYIKLW